MKGMQFLLPALRKDLSRSHPSTLWENFTWRSPHWPADCPGTQSAKPTPLPTPWVHSLVQQSNTRKQSAFWATDQFCGQGKNYKWAVVSLSGLMSFKNQNRYKSLRILLHEGVTGVEQVYQYKVRENPRYKSTNKQYPT